MAKLWVEYIERRIDYERDDDSIYEKVDFELVSCRRVEPIGIRRRRQDHLQKLILNQPDRIDEIDSLRKQVSARYQFIETIAMPRTGRKLYAAVVRFSHFGKYWICEGEWAIIGVYFSPTVAEQKCREPAISLPKTACVTEKYVQPVIMV